MSKHPNRKIKPRKRAYAHHLSENIIYGGNFDIPTTVRLIQYDKLQVTVKDVLPDTRLYDCLKPGTVSWFKVVGFTDIKRISAICKELGVERFDVRNMFSGQRMTRVVAYPETTLMFISDAYVNEDKMLETEQLVLVLGKGFVITFQESGNPLFDEVEQAIGGAQVQLREKAADYLLYILLNSIYAQIDGAIYQFIDRLSDLEDLLIDKADTDINVMGIIRNGKANYMSMRRIISPMREEYVNLLHNSNNLISVESLIYFNDFDDKLRASLGDLDIYSESLRSLQDLYYNNNNQRMNDIIKRLTIVSSIFIPLTFLVGVWGMNFDVMPELNWQYGYLFAWGVMALVTVVAIWLLKRKGWF
ncbi:magnesium transporter [Dysgonomonas sp. PH5-45]|uniref:magnesium/cobalt transporter CorA n=1 Tax=unclassified Dysgonomonas TaxID=2630389 RepID=UPI0024751B01|nr:MULTISPECIES: magnesium/cobalt transporter CorA [unclassified Dysgonomonas]MDH6355233.1 magnesium transporter [Dysgonomonas sp. PH5-45]MDH6388144.1 magnesium transporter [Dysgonomonas sp. PH5-37]